MSELAGKEDRKPTKKEETQRRRIRQCKCCYIFLYPAETLVVLRQLCSKTDVINEMLQGAISENTMEKAKALMGRYKHGMPKIQVVIPASVRLPFLIQFF